MGESRNPSDPVSQGLDPKTSTLRLRFRVKSGLPSVAHEDNNNGWDAILWRGRLYISVGASQMADSGSKEAFVALLEYAEEILECSHVIVCIDRRQSNNTKMAIRNFLFLGFQPLAPGHEFLPSNPNLVWSLLFHCLLLAYRTPLSSRSVSCTPSNGARHFTIIPFNFYQIQVVLDKIQTLFNRSTKSFNSPLLMSAI